MVLLREDNGQAEACLSRRKCRAGRMPARMPAWQAGSPLYDSGARRASLAFANGFHELLVFHLPPLYPLEYRPAGKRLPKKLPWQLPEHSGGPGSRFFDRILRRFGPGAPGP